MNIGTQISSYTKTLRGRLRPLFIALLALMFLIPLSMVEDVVRDRTHYRDQSISSIATSWADKQTLTGPVLIMPYTVMEKSENFDSEKNKIVVTQNKVTRKQVAIPATLNIDTSLKSEERKRGLYKIPVYVASISLQGQFNGIKEALAAIASENGTLEEPFISLAVSDIRGIGGTPVIVLNDKTHTPAPGSRMGELKEGVHVPLDDLASAGDALNFAITFDLKGMNEFHVMPVGGTVTMKMTSDWPHPSFNGRFLPDDRQIGKDGFTAQWKTGLLATNILDAVTDCVRLNRCTELMQKSSGVGLFQPVDIYKQSNRAVKYGLLFVALTFVLFYITETLKGLHVSLPQFLLVGGALAVFFLLLVSLAEHIGFALAYLAAASATVALLAYYVSYVLKGRKLGLQTGLVLAILYAVLYVILLSEDYALLMGSLLLFLLIAGIMVVTRNVDWENLGPGQGTAKNESKETL